MALPIGIDLGTTNSVISVYRRGRADTLRVDGRMTMPSAVCFRDKRTTLVGTNALGMAMIRPEQTILSVKRKMGDRKFKYRVHDQDFSPIDISAMILEKLCEGQEEALGGKACDAVITVPAYFTDEQRRDTREAGEKAGLNVLRLLPEPTAAAIAIGLDKGRDQTILVYDLGGGTFDVSILKIEKNVFRVMAVNGNHDLGGNDFDAALRQHALELFRKHQGIDLRKESTEDSQVRQALQMLTSACERIKMELSEAEEAFLDLPNFFGGKHLEASISRREFEGLIKNLIYETKDLVLKTVSEAKLSVDDIDRLVLVGGSTKIPLVARVLADTIKEPYLADNVDLAVSAGAAIMASNLTSMEEFGGSAGDFAPAEVNVTDVVAHPISVAMLNELNQLKCYRLIEKNSPLPATGMELGLAQPGQPIVQLPVYRGPHDDPEKNDYLGLLTMTVTVSPKITLLRCELTLDEDGILVVEGGIVDMKGLDPAEIAYMPKDKLRVTKKVRTEIKLPN